MFRFRQNKRNEGQSMVEFALALPVFLLIVFGLMEFGMLIFNVATVNASAREGARYGAAQGFTDQYLNCAGIEGAVEGIGRLVGIDATNVSISYDHGSSADPHTGVTCANVISSDITEGDRISVTVTHIYTPLMRNILGLPIPELTLPATVRRLILKDIVIEGAAGVAETVDCDLLIVGPIIGDETTSATDDFIESSNTLTLNISNGTDEIMQIDTIRISWPAVHDDNGAITEISNYTDTVSLWSGSTVLTPLTVSDAGGDVTWIGSTETSRQIAVAGAKDIGFVFDQNVTHAEADNDYVIAVVLTSVDSGDPCSKTVEFDALAGTDTVTCEEITLGAISASSFSGSTMTLPITNNSSVGDIRIDQLTLSWPSDLTNGALNSMALGAESFWSTGDSASSFNGDSGDWDWNTVVFTNPDDPTIYKDGGTNNLIFTFAGVASSLTDTIPYELTIDFKSEDGTNTGCAKYVTYDDNGIDECALISGGLVQGTGGDQNEFTATITNDNAGAINITAIDMIWDSSSTGSSGFGDLNSAKRGAIELYGASESNPLNSPGSDPWLGTPNLSIADSGGTISLVFSFDSNIDTDDFTSITFTFDNACTLSPTFP